MKTLNINTMVRIKLTDTGIKKLKKNYEKLRAQFPVMDEFTPPKTDKDGYCKMELWEFMNEFGDILFNGSEYDSPFEDNAILIDDNDFEPEN